MFGGLVALLIPFLLVAALVVALVLSSRHRLRLDVSVHDDQDVIAIARTTRTWRLVGLALGVAAALVLVLASNSAALGRWMALAPMAVGAGVLLGTIVGELTARVNQGPTRTAVLESRSAKRLLNHPGLGSTLVSAAALGGILLVGSAMGSADDLGRAGRALVRECLVTLPSGETTEMMSRRGPWPGSFYAAPLWLAALCLVALAAVALVAIARRRRPSPQSMGLDTVLRTWAAGNVLAALSGTFLITAGALALSMLVPLAGPDCRPTDQLVLLWILAVLGPVGLCLGLSHLLSLLLGPRIVLDDRPPHAPGEVTPVGVPRR